MISKWIIKKQCVRVLNQVAADIISGWLKEWNFLATLDYCQRQNNECTAWNCFQTHIIHLDTQYDRVVTIHLNETDI